MSHRPSSVPLARRASLLAFAAATAVGLATASAADANFLATATDPAGDAADPARDITAVAMSYDRRGGELLGAIRFRGEPAEGTRSFVTLVAGTRTATGCNGYPAAGFGSFSDEYGASWLRFDDGGGTAAAKGDADKRGGGTTVQRFEIADRGQLAGRKLDCVTATVTEAGNAANVYDAVGPIALVGQPSLGLRLSGVPRVLSPGRGRKLRLTISNAGDAPTGRVRLRLGSARGLKASPRSISLKSVAAGGTRTATVRVSLSARARTTTTLKVTATAGALQARQQADLFLRKPSSGGGGRGRGTGSCVRYQADLSGESGGSLILVPC